ncbi:MAG TPA: methyltransferase domain-containing protein [Acetobacteraceae bacterium]|jgi:SAM-dependent methyltransferase|nr:methyltransferase domain-containing protein [Acetobacteraceae bacterium]
MTDDEWRRVNRANWDERVAVHLGPGGYTLSGLRAGRADFDPIVAAELPPLAGTRVLHLQCHFGADTLRLLLAGAAEVVGLDFSRTAIATARDLAAELRLSERARFIEADLYDAMRAIPAPHDFDIVFVTWGAIVWLPDIRAWAGIVAALLRPGGMFYFAEGHPTANVFDDGARAADGRPGFGIPYFQEEAFVDEDPTDYADPDARLANARTFQWLHPLGAIITALIDAGLTIEFLHEHDAVTWRMYACLVRGEDGLYRWPDKPWLPLAFSLRATKR